MLIIVELQCYDVAWRGFKLLKVFKYVLVFCKYLLYSIFVNESGNIRVLHPIHNSGPI